MALVSLFFQTRAKIGQLDLDVSISETHEAAATLSQSQIEDGSTITDNVVLAPYKLTIEGMVSKTPLNSSALLGSAATALGGAVGAAQSGSSAVSSLAGAAAGAALGSIGGLVSSALGADGGVKSREPKDVFAYLLELRDRRQPFEVVTALRHYENMILTSVSVPRNSQTTGGLRFTATMEKITYVKAVTVGDMGSVTSIASEAKEKANLGKQATGTASAKASGSIPSILSQATGLE